MTPPNAQAHPPVGPAGDPTVDIDKLPWPGEELVNRVTGGTDRLNFFTSGRQSVRDLEAVLALIHRQLSDYGTILDFGSGCGRIMLWLERLSGTSALHGVDIDERAMQWSRENMPWATFKANQPLPPLDYPDATFDLVYNHSVFTHIDENYQDQWLAELRRVVKPGGHLILSVHGEPAFLVFEENVAKSGVGDPSIIRRELQTRGISFIHDDAFTGGPFPDFYHSTFHAPWYVFEHWGRYFTVAAYVPRGSMGFQDFVLLQRPADDAPGVVKGQPITVQPVSGKPVGGAAAAGDGAGAGSAAVGTAGLGGATEDALHRAGRLLHAGFDGGLDAQGATATVRRMVDRAVRSRASYQRQVDEAMFTALYELRAALDQRTTGAGGVPVAELNARLWDALRLQGQRINRLETDLWEAMRSGPATPPATGDEADPPAG